MITFIMSNYLVDVWSLFGIDLKAVSDELVQMVSVFGGGRNDKLTRGDGQGTFSKRSCKETKFIKETA